MPRDDWRKAQDKDHGRRAASEYAATGRTSYEYAWDEVSPKDRKRGQCSVEVEAPVSEVEEPVSRPRNHLLRIRRMAETMNPAMKADQRIIVAALEILPPRDMTAFRSIAKTLERESHSLRVLAAQVLGAIGPVELAVPALAKALVQSQGKGEIGQVILDALHKFGPKATAAIPALIKALEFKNIREQVIATLIKVGGEAAPALKNTLAHPDGSVRLAAVQALSRITRSERPRFGAVQRKSPRRKR